jgi:hypothetical protein
VGNGNFAFTVDATGLQTFPNVYANGVPLGTQSSWGWHSFPNTNGYQPAEALRSYSFRGREELYSVQIKDKERAREAVSYLRANPHRLHLGLLGFEGIQSPADVGNIRQRLDLWTGSISSRFELDGDSVRVLTAVHPKRDAVSAHITSPLFAKGKLKIALRFPYPTAQHSDDACRWDVPDRHHTEILTQTDSSLTLKRTLDSAVYYVQLSWRGRATVQSSQHRIALAPQEDNFELVCELAPALQPTKKELVQGEVFSASAAHWQRFWEQGGVVDFSSCTDPRAAELERRVVLSQYLLAIQCAGMYPPQETGLTYNSWFGKFHLEMQWWHAAHFPLWRHDSLLLRSMDWYETVLPTAREIAARQGFAGARWMKMTDPSGAEAPSSVGSFLIWQQPHIIYMLELLYRNHPSDEFVKRYAHLVDTTAAFMASFADYDAARDRYILKGIIAAQETLRASETVNPPLEVSYWLYALKTANLWRERQGLPRNAKWDEVADKLSPLAHKDSLYLASENALDTYTDIRFTSDHPAVLGAVGILPESRLLEHGIMQNTLNWIWDKWNWNETWGWDYPMVAMCAARMGNPQQAVDALLMDKRTNTYLVNGHNYQDSRLRVYLPGNGGLLTAIAMMCAGWDGCTVENPGFPKDGSWNVRWENLEKLP